MISHFMPGFPPVKSFVSVCLRVKEPTQTKWGAEPTVINAEVYPHRCWFDEVAALHRFRFGPFGGSEKLPSFPVFFCLEEPIFDGSFTVGFSGKIFLLLGFCKANFDLGCWKFNPTKKRFGWSLNPRWRFVFW